MFELGSQSITPPIKAMLTPDEPAGLRMLGVLDGILPGAIFVDRFPDPTWAVVQEAEYGTIYLGGFIDRQELGDLIDRLRNTGDVLLGMWPEDGRWNLVPPGADYEGQVLDFYERPFGTGLDDFLVAIPAGCEIRQVDVDLFERSRDRVEHIRSFGSLENTLNNLLGFYLMRDDEILCEALAGPMIRGIREIGVVTYEGHRRKGYGTVTCAYLVQACENTGLQTYWNCNKSNTASAALARSLGYRVEKEYELKAWFRSKTTTG
jgi:GNAT superfamily N-acetyltransferase